MTLPEGWSRVRFADAIEVVRGITFSKDQRSEVVADGYVQCLRSGNVQRALTIENLIYVPDAVVKSPDRYVRNGDTIVSMSNSYDLVGKVALATNLHEGMTFGAFLSAFRSDVLDARFLYCLLRAPHTQSAMRATASQTVNISNISIGGLADIALLLPPTAEQRRIVTKLDALTDRLARARAELDRVSVLAANLKAAALTTEYQSLCDRGGTAPIEQFIATLDQGWSPKCESFPAADEGTWAVLKTTAIQALEFRPWENKTLPAGLPPRPKIEVAAGDILITRAGPRVRCGIACLVKETRPRLMLADKMYRVRCKPAHALPAYLALMLNAPATLRLIEGMKTGISDSGLNLTQDKFLSIAIPRANLDEQREAVDRLEIALARTNRLEAEAARARALIDRLESAILAKAFRGELVPQDPNDEPASVLLDRIRAERTAKPKAKRGRRAATAA